MLNNGICSAELRQQKIPVYERDENKKIYCVMKWVLVCPKHGIFNPRKNNTIKVALEETKIWKWRKWTSKIFPQK